jgi:hypothetical protein
VVRQGSTQKMMISMGRGTTMMLFLVNPKRGRKRIKMKRRQKVMF